MTGVFGEDIKTENIIRQIKEAGNSPIDMYFNTPGGNLRDAEAIIEAMELSGSTITGHIAPFAASAGSYTLTACSGGVYAYPDSVHQIHNASALIFAHAELMRKQADRLDNIDFRIAERLASFAKMDVIKVLEMMSAADDNSGTWLYGEEIKNMGFATVYDDLGDKPIYQETAQARQQFDSMVAAHSKNNGVNSEVGKLRAWISKNPDNVEIKRLVDDAIKTGKGEDNIYTKLVLAEFNNGGPLTPDDIAAAKAVNMSLSDYRKYRSLAV